MYKIKVKKGSLPKALKRVFHTYDEARAALRIYFRDKLPIVSGHPSISDMKAIGYSIVK